MNTEEQARLEEDLKKQHLMEMNEIADRHFDDMKLLDKAHILNLIGMIFEEGENLEKVVDSLTDYVHDARKTSFGFARK
tara:strand:- start:704 stop:940 length:237 start_codon:yes stop_codon:yes gene_type:complete